jgi:hypothetical protein
VANEDDNYIQLVETMVRSRIEQQCIILVTIPMSDDMENQRAMRIAKQVDPTGLRTIGIYTSSPLLAYHKTN